MERDVLLTGKRSTGGQLGGIERRAKLNDEETVAVRKSVVDDIRIA